jgi:hypothetical protein
VTVWIAAAVVANVLVLALIYYHGVVVAFLFWLAVWTLLLALLPAD